MAGSTVKIHRSRTLSFRKLSFLYLVFIVFYFFSTSGDYIKQYEPMSKTQGFMNQILLEQLKEIECKNLEDISLKNNVIEYVAQLDQMNNELQSYIGKSITIDEKLKELKFSKNFVQNGNFENFKKSTLSLVAQFPEDKKQILLDEFKFSSQDKNSLFANIPNGFLGNIFLNYQTIALKNSISTLSSKLEPKTIESKPEPKPVEEKNPFLQSLKSVYYLGEEVEFSIHNTTENKPVLKINENEIQLNPAGENVFAAIWTPNKPGIYKVLVSNSEREQTQQIEVKAVDLNFLENSQEVVCTMNETFTLTPYFSENLNIKDFKFISKEAAIEIEGNHLNITPLVEGRFNLLVKLGNQTLENLSLYSKINIAPRVLLKDKYNQFTSTCDAYSLNTEFNFWQVVGFDLIVIQADGSKKTFHSNNKYLNSEMLDAQKNIKEGDGMVFEQIKLLFKDGVKTTNGSAIYIQK
jgi:hypothetical protein